MLPDFVLKANNCYELGTVYIKIIIFFFKFRFLKIIAAKEKYSICKYFVKIHQPALQNYV